MKLTRLGHRFSWDLDGPPCPGRLAEARLGLQLMRGRYPATASRVTDLDRRPRAQ